MRDANAYADRPDEAGHDLDVADDIRRLVADFTASLAPYAKSFEMADGNTAVLDLIGMIDDACSNTMGSIIVDCECAIADAAVARTADERASDVARYHASVL